MAIVLSFLFVENQICVVNSDHLLLLHTYMYILMISPSNRAHRLWLACSLVFRVSSSLWSIRFANTKTHSERTLRTTSRKRKTQTDSFFCNKHFDQTCLLLHCYRLSICAERFLLVFFLSFSLFLHLSSVLYLLPSWLLFSSSFFLFRPLRSAKHIFIKNRFEWLLLIDTSSTQLAKRWSQANTEHIARANTDGGRTLF